MSFVHFTAFLSFVVLVLSKPLGGPVVVPRQDGTPGAPLSPEQTVCGDIIVDTKYNYTIFYADVVFKCLQSVPFNAAVATRFIDYYNMTLQFQSTLAYLKDPPQGYQQPPVDVLQVLDQIQGNVTAGNYKNQYTFEADVQLLVNRMHDSHVTLNAGILDALSFLSPYGLVSVSADGKQPPEVYLSDDLLMGQLEGWTPSPVTKINGQVVVEYLTQFAELNSNGYLEPHADWNSLMDTPAMWISGDLSIFQSATFYPGDELNFTFKNGSTEETYWLSFYNELEDTGPLTTAGDFYNYFVLGQLPASYDPDQQWWHTLETDDSSNDDSSDNSTVTDPFESVCSSGNPADVNWCLASYGAYPNDPVVVQTDLAVTGGGVVTGYFYDDISTGVLSIPSFFQYDPNTEQFGLTVEYFIANATKNNISRLVIDLQQNTGGTVYLAYNTFKQFFYRIDPYAASRIRSHELANVLGGAFSKWWKELESDLEGNDGANGVNYNYTAAEEWVVLNRINAATGRDFASWSEYYGPVSDHGDTFSLAQRYNLSDEVPYGYGIAADDDPRPQARVPEDIIILTDGMCASACALFVELMTHQAGVRTVAVGGRPTTGPMQAVSGSRGARVYEASELDDDFRFVSETIENSTAAALLPNRSDTGVWVTSAGINIRDQVRENDLTPLQFKYEAADCRIYYTLANVFNMTRLWRDAATAAWDDPSLCVDGSTGFPTARNTSSAQAPPERTAQAPSLDLDLAEFVNFAGNNTGGLADGGLRPTGEIISCTSNSQCNGGQCLPTTLVCNGVPRSVNACLPKCSSADPSCPGSSDCFYETGLPSKLNTVAGRNAALKKPVQQGHCRPRAPSPKLACPR
ncbi:hypothetical protein K469DRAFT_746897 [Zopfia rhizophila CBS 207.26]|uniref:Uncharacterized protein n=1 Tax=Zopfia rhizophila CBS 207.26 TaxID=1314779 RepID=A0A6A6EEB7_9PEZI|nr:hypothetical protein K469DRAFT_746897 [Zopfia rhizophila CBS 207.26]